MIYEVVDGHQRLNTIIGFFNDKWPLIPLKSGAYPISLYYTPLIGKTYSELPSDLQDIIWNYPLAVQELRGMDDAQIRALFRRLNYVVERLNKQEMRHSQYFGEFVEAVEELAKDKFWIKAKLFTPREYQRMRDIEFVSELFVLIIDGVQDQQKNLDNFYAKFDADFPSRADSIYSGSYPAATK